MLTAISQSVKANSIALYVMSESKAHYDKDEAEWKSSCFKVCLKVLRSLADWLTVMTLSFRLKLQTVDAEGWSCSIMCLVTWWRSRVCLFLNGILYIVEGRRAYRHRTLQWWSGITEMCCSTCWQYSFWVIKNCSRETAVTVDYCRLVTTLCSEKNIPFYFLL